MTNNSVQEQLPVVDACQSPSMTSADNTETIRLHLALNVANLEKSIAFFETFFDRAPAKCHPDYAKFELENPPFVLSLEPSTVSPGGSLNHLGFRMPHAQALVEVQRRLELAGFSTRREEGVECCYARQTKFWVYDPDGNMWEVYTLDQDIGHRGLGQVPDPATLDQANANSPSNPADSIWNHKLQQPFPITLPILDQTVDRVHLQGTFNEILTDADVQRRLEEVFRILKPAGSVQFHLLTADRAPGNLPINLPGPAAAVKAVPALEDLLTAIKSAGFSDVTTIYHADNPCFTVQNFQFRETRLQAIK